MLNLACAHATRGNEAPQSLMYVWQVAGCLAPESWYTQLNYAAKLKPCTIEAPQQEIERSAPCQW